MPRSLKNCNNFQDLKDLARRRLPGPIYHYIDGAAEDETTYQRNTEAFQDVDLIPNVLAGVENIDMSVEVMGYKLGLPIFVLQPLYRDCFIIKAKEQLQKQLKNSTPYLVCLL